MNAKVNFLPTFRRCQTFAQIARIFYGYPNYEHQFVDKICQKCGWNGNVSEFILTLQKQSTSQG